MTKYRVKIAQTVIEESWVTVEAANPEAAELEAIRKGREGFDTQWHFTECYGDIDAIAVEEEAA